MTRKLQLKRIAAVAISIFFFGFSKLRKGAARIGGKDVQGTCVVLYYHMVQSGQRLRFASQMDTLQRLARPTRVDRTDPLSAGVHYAAVTFDDGYENVVENALPELHKRGIPSTWFIIADALGKHPDWLTESYSSAEFQAVMSQDQLMELPASLVTVGSHTMTHPALPSLNESDAKRELSESRAKLEALLNRKVKLFSFPYGALNARLIAWCRESGYERVFSTSPALAFSDPSEFVTGRVPVEPTDWPLEFRLKLMGAYCWLPAAISLKRKLRAVLRGPMLTRIAEVGGKDCSLSGS